MLESPISNERWHLLYERFGGFQFWLVDEATDEILAEGNSLPVRLDLADLPDRGLGVRRSSMRRTATRSRRSSRRSRCSSTATGTGRGLSALMLGEMRRIATAAGFGDLVAPVRPSLKSRYPLTPIERVRHLDDATRGCRSTRGSGCTRAPERRSRRSAPSR